MKGRMTFVEDENLKLKKELKEIKENRGRIEGIALDLKKSMQS